MTRNRMQFAGSWYPAQPEPLAALLNAAMLELGGEPEGTAPATQALGGIRPLRAAVLPHAGLHYSARGMAPFWRGANRSSAGRQRAVLIIAPSHYSAPTIDRLHVASFTSHETPFGNLAGVPDFWLNAAGAPDLLSSAPELIAREHAVEMYLPGIYHHFGAQTAVTAAIVPALSSLGHAEQLAGLVGHALGELGRRYGAAAPLLIVSSDFTHYGPRFAFQPHGRGSSALAAVRDADLEVAAAAAAMDAAALWRLTVERRSTVCGRYVLVVGALVAAAAGWSGTAVDYYTSAERSESSAVPTDFVAYATVLYHGAEAEAHGTTV